MLIHELIACSSCGAPKGKPCGVKDEKPTVCLFRLRDALLYKLRDPRKVRVVKKERKPFKIEEEQ